ncbi:sugar MFS transporter [Mucilaginibacter rubeus]|uniref:Sugar MFS transporter n=1 Tax=Mucilaginibacter rubeus TaxID=2027860 RepID=A0AAE6JFH7_9SPHI|nr:MULTISPECIES: hypothetical protein [Mucilaginibacter]QEM04441.1 sugar MFS transporter [Mucilaginibacter rubeus]QEM17037.1 sugar MFS transporter [Mucilaginibacter gossypii]QTE46466.1 hypothetical protein J3L19_14275 [Mucilaginibacter rubeus]QTE53063.1 hypothetical protein J3L21_14250 [Mucilaginibacter rubeus]QTE58150.1 hypothetical protein J3L23_05920 [Mucilaginibacter rubeus]
MENYSAKGFLTILGYTESKTIHLQLMKKNYYIVTLITLTFFVISFLSDIIWSLSPEFIKDFKPSDVMAGGLPFAFFIAYGVISIPSSMLVQKYNEKTILHSVTCLV